MKDEYLEDEEDESSEFSKCEICGYITEKGKRICYNCMSIMSFPDTMKQLDLNNN